MRVDRKRFLPILESRFYKVNVPLQTFYIKVIHIYKIVTPLHHSFLIISPSRSSSRSPSRFSKKLLKALHKDS